MESADPAHYKTDGVKYDGEKPRMDLLEPVPLEDMAKVLTFGAKKYADDNWKKIPDLKRRYYAAALRHLCAWRDGFEDDVESGLPHLAHAACCIHFLQWAELHKPHGWPHNDNGDKEKM